MINKEELKLKRSIVEQTERIKRLDERYLVERAELVKRLQPERVERLYGRYAIEWAELIKRLTETYDELTNLSKDLSRKDESEVKIPVKKEKIIVIEGEIV